MGIQCVCVYVCGKFWSPPNNFQTSYPIDTKFRLHIAAVSMGAAPKLCSVHESRLEVNESTGIGAVV